MRKELVFLGFVISQGTLKMDPKKVDVIINWPPPKNPDDVRIFHGLSTFYRKFIKKFSDLFCNVYMLKWCHFIWCLIR